MYRVFFRRKVHKRLLRMPLGIQNIFANLVEDLERKGLIRKEWPNFSKIEAAKYHCHLSHHWVACWKVEESEMEIEVYYAGSREDAPY